MAVSRRSSRSRFTLLLLVLTSITVITLDFRGQGAGVVESVRDVALDTFAPVQSVTDTVFSPVTNAWNGITNYDDLEAENARLQAETGMPILIADNPLTSVAVGSGQSLEEFEALKGVLFSSSSH